MTLHEDDPQAWLIAHEEIRQLASRYAVAMGHRNHVAVAKLFVPDVRVGRSQEGRGALSADFERQMAPIGRAVLHVTNHVIDVTDRDNATGIVGCRAELELDGDWVVQMIEYHDTYRRTDEGWKFVRRRHLLWYGAPTGSNPMDLPPANWPASAVGSGDLPDSAVFHL